MNPLKLALPPPPGIPCTKGKAAISSKRTHLSLLSLSLSLSAPPSPASSFIRGAYLHASLQSRFHEITVLGSVEQDNVKVMFFRGRKRGGRLRSEAADWNSHRAGAAHRLLLFLRMNDQNDRFEAKVDFLFLLEETFVSGRVTDLRTTSIMIETRWLKGDGNVRRKIETRLLYI